MRSLFLIFFSFVQLSCTINSTEKLSDKEWLNSLEQSTERSSINKLFNDNTDPTKLFFKLRIVGKSDSDPNLFRTFFYGPTLAYWVNIIELDSKVSEHGYIGTWDESDFSTTFTNGTGKGNGDYGFVTDKTGANLKTEYLDLGQYGVISYDLTKERNIQYVYYMYGPEDTYSIKGEIEILLPKGLDTSKIHLFTINIKDKKYPGNINYNISYDGYEGQITPPNIVYDNILYKVRFDVDNMSTPSGDPMFKIAGEGVYAGKTIYADLVNVFGQRFQPGQYDSNFPYRYSKDAIGYGLKTEYNPHPIKLSYDPSKVDASYIKGVADISANNKMIATYNPDLYRPGMVPPYETTATKLTELNFNLSLPTNLRIEPGRVHLFTIVYRSWSPIPALHFDGIE